MPPCSTRPWGFRSSSIPWWASAAYSYLVGKSSASRWRGRSFGPVMVLDDPLSAVDAKTESLILEAIERKAQERTLVLITHRVDAAKRCDQILVLDKGRVVERGTHEELCKQGGLYAVFEREQSREGELRALAEVSP
jgi:ABC-type hemin transport system ATPase subunit